MRNGDEGCAARPGFMLGSAVSPQSSSAFQNSGAREETVVLRDRRISPFWILQISDLNAGASAGRLTEQGTQHWRILPSGTTATTAKVTGPNWEGPPRLDPLS
jgi:hypothetical protein